MCCVGTHSRVYRVLTIELYEYSSKVRLVRYSRATA